MAKQRRNAVDEILGSASPVARKIRAQKEAARKAQEEAHSGEVTPEIHHPKVIEPQPNRRLASKRSEVGDGPSKRTGSELQQKKRKPAKRIPVTGSEGEVWEDVCRTLSTCVGAKVTFAAASRAIWSMIVDHEEDFREFEAPHLEKPAHANAVANAEFEMQLRGFILEVIQKSRKR